MDIEKKIDEDVWRTVCRAVDNHVTLSMRDSISESAWYSVDDLVHDSIWRSMYRSVKNTIRNKLSEYEY